MEKAIGEPVQANFHRCASTATIEPFPSTTTPKETKQADLWFRGTRGLSAGLRVSVLWPPLAGAEKKTGQNPISH